MDRLPFRRTFELRNFISTVEKGVINLVKLWSLVAKYRCCKIFGCEIQSFIVCEFCMLLYYARQSDNHFRNLIMELKRWSCPHAMKWLKYTHHKCKCLSPWERFRKHFTKKRTSSNWYVCFDLFRFHMTDVRAKTKMHW